MDEELKALERLARANPDDEMTALKIDAIRRRLGTKPTIHNPEDIRKALKLAVEAGFQVVFAKVEDCYLVGKTHQLIVPEHWSRV